MDMWEPYYKAVCEHVPLAEFRIVFDRFHIMQHMGGAVDSRHSRRRTQNRR